MDYDPPGLRPAAGAALLLSTPRDGPSVTQIPRGNILLQRQPDPVETARIAKLKADYEAAVQAKDWENTALLLNAFNDDTS